MSVRFVDLKLTKTEMIVAEDLDRLREMYSQITLDTYIEPKLLWEIDSTKKSDQMRIIITEPDDINCWIRGISYSSVIKMRYLEESIMQLLSRGDMYSSSILIRHHMEQCGLLCLSLEVLLDFDKAKLERFISKTFYGTSFYNNPKLRHNNQAAFRTETVTVSAMIRALDVFLQNNLDKTFLEEYVNFFTHNYAFLCQFSHPSSDTTSFFVDGTRLDDGASRVQFRWEPNFGKTSMRATLYSLYQHLRIGLACFYLLTAYHVSDDGTLMCDEENVKVSFEILTGKKVESD